MARTGAWVVAVLSFVALPARAAEGDPESWSLSEAIEVSDGECISGDAIRASVENWLGRSAIDRRIRIVVDEIEPGRPRFVVTREGKPAAERRFRSDRVPCADLRAAVALAIALAIDATILESVLEPLPPAEPPPPPAPKPTPKPEPKPEPAPPPKPKPPPPLDPVEGEAALIALVGVLPDPNWGGSVGLLIPTGPLTLRVVGWGTAGSDVPIGRGTARVAMAAGELGACLRHALGGVRARGCAGLAAGAWSGRGSGFQVNRVTAVPWLSAVAGLGLEVPVAGDVALFGAVAGYFPVVRPSLEVSDPGGSVIDRVEAPPAGVGSSLGVTVAFP